MRKCAVLAVLLLAGATANAAALAQYEFGSNLSPTSTAPAVTASAITPGHGPLDYTDLIQLDYNSVAAPMVSPVATVYPYYANSTGAGALAAGDYFQFTVTPGTTMSLTSLEADWTRGGSSTDRGFAVFTSTNGVNFTQQGADVLIQASGQSSANEHDLVNLSGLDGVAGPVTFRVAAWVNSGAGSYRDIVMDNLAVGGTVPEPATMALMGLGLFGLVTRRKRK
jgi:hypothetical protein